MTDLLKTPTPLPFLLALSLWWNWYPWPVMLPIRWALLGPGSRHISIRAAQSMSSCMRKSLRRLAVLSVSIESTLSRQTFNLSGQMAGVVVTLVKLAPHTGVKMGIRDGNSTSASVLKVTSGWCLPLSNNGGSGSQWAGGRGPYIQAAQWFWFQWGAHPYAWSGCCTQMVYSHDGSPRFWDRKASCIPSWQWVVARAWIA